MDKETKKEQKKEMILKVFSHLVFLLFLAGTFWASFLSANSRNHPAERFFFLVLAMLGGLCVAICIIKLYLPRILEKIINGLVSPKKYMTKPAPLLSRPRSLIVQKQYGEAEEILCSILQEYPADPAVTFILAELYCLHVPDPEKMQKLCRNYFREGPQVISKENIRILLLYTDTLLQEGKREEAINILQRETGKNNYQKEDISSIQKRLSALTRH